MIDIALFESSCQRRHVPVIWVADAPIERDTTIVIPVEPREDRYRIGTFSILL